MEPGGELAGRTIDTDIHPSISGSGILARLKEPWRSRYASGNRGPGHLGYWNPNGVGRSDTVLGDGSRIEGDPRLLEHHFMDPYGIGFGILNPGGHIGVSPDPDFAAAVVSASNDTVVEEWLEKSDRLRASMMVSPADPLLGAEEIYRLGDHPGIVQVLMPSGARFPYGQRMFHPIYEAAEAKGLPVALHPGSEGAGVSGPPTAAGYPTTYFEWHTGLVTSYMAHLISMVTEGVFIKYPKLKFVLVEGGVSWLPPLLWRFDKNWKALRQTTPWLERPPSEIVMDHVLLTTQPIEEPDDIGQLHQMLGMFDAGRMLMFSSDFPHWDGDTPDFAARLLPESIRERVMAGTASELYGIDTAGHRDADAHPQITPIPQIDKAARTSSSLSGEPRA